MAVTLKRKVVRKLLSVSATKKGRICKPHEIGLPVIIELSTDEVIRFRVKGTRTVYEIHSSIALQVAQRNHSLTIYKNALAEYELKKAAGYKRLRKPKKPILI